MQGYLTEVNFHLPIQFTEAEKIKSQQSLKYVN